MKKKLYYPFYDEKISKHLIKNNFNNDFIGFSREMSMLIGVGVLVYFIFTLNYTKPYVYKCGFFTSSFLILFPGGMLLFLYIENKSELLLLFFLSLFVFNFLVFFIFKHTGVASSKVQCVTLANQIYYHTKKRFY